MRKQSPMLQAVAMGFRVLMVYGCFSCRGRKPQLLPVRMHMPYQAKALPFSHLFSIAYQYDRVGKGYFNPATPYDTGQAKVAECLTHQGYRAVQPRLHCQRRLHCPMALQIKSSP
jgi:hypothetical protein